MAGEPRPELSALLTHTTEARVAAVAGVTPEVQKAANLADTLRQFDLSNPDTPNGHKAFEAMTPNARPITETSVNPFQLQIGAGEAVQNPKTGKIELPPGSSAEAHALQDETGAALDQILDVQRYIDISTEVAKGATPADVVRKMIDERKIIWPHKTPPTATELNDLYRETQVNARKTISDLEVIRQEFPELAANPDLLDIAIIENPHLRTALAKNTNAVLEQVQNLPDVKSEEIRAQEHEVAVNQLVTDEQIDALFKQFGSRAKLTKSQFRTWVLSQSSPDGLSNNMLEKVGYETCGTDPDVVEYCRVSNELQRNEARLSELTEALKITTLPAPERAKLAAEKGRLDALLPNARTTVSGLETLLIGSRGQTADTLTHHKATYQRLETDVLGTLQSDGTRKGGIGERTRAIFDSQRKITDAQREILAYKGSDEHRSRVQARLAAESQLVSQLGSVVEQSVVDTLNDSYDNFSAQQSRMTAKDAEESKKRGEENVSKAEEALAQSMDENWIHFDPKDRRRHVYLDKIGHDIRHIAYQGDEGVKQLIRRDLISRGALQDLSYAESRRKAELSEHMRRNPSSVTPAEAAEMSFLYARSNGFTVAESREFAALQGKATRTPAETNRLNELNNSIPKRKEEQKQLLDTVHKSQGDRYVKRLMADYGAASNEHNRNWRHRELHGKGQFRRLSALRLRKHEQMLLERQFGDKLLAAVNTAAAGNEKAQQKIAEAQGKGKMTFKVLIGILAALGLAGAMAGKGFTE